MKIVALMLSLLNVAAVQPSDGDVANALLNHLVGRWTMTGRLNVARFADTATLLADGRVLVTGGYSHGGFTNTAEVYDPATGAWTRTGNMSTLRAGHSATLLRGRAYTYNFDATDTTGRQADYSQIKVSRTGLRLQTRAINRICYGYMTSMAYSYFPRFSRGLARPSWRR